jgi:hypothetical protein
MPALSRADGRRIAALFGPPQPPRTPRRGHQNGHQRGATTAKSLKMATITLGIRSRRSGSDSAAVASSHSSATLALVSVRAYTEPTHPVIEDRGSRQACRRARRAGPGRGIVEGHLSRPDLRRSTGRGRGRPRRGSRLLIVLDPRERGTSRGVRAFIVAGSGVTIGMLRWMPTRCCGSCAPMQVVTAAPQSPPCAACRAWPSRAIRAAQTFAMRCTT